MTDSILVPGQSNGSNLWVLSGISTLSSALNSLTGKSVSIIQGAVAGSSLLKASAQSGYPHLHWGDQYDTSSPLYAALQNDLSALRAVLWIGTEQDASVSASINALVNRYDSLRADIASVAGKRARDLPFMLAMLGKATTCYSGGWMARRAQEIAIRDYGFIEGPEYIDLAVESDNIHMTSASRETFATRAANLLAPIIGIAASGGSAPQTFSGTITRDSATASGSQPYTPSGLTFTPTSIDFSASLGGSYTSSGSDNGTSPHCTFADGGSGGSRTDSSIYCYAASSGNGYKGKVSAFASGGFTIDWTRISTPGGNVSVSYTAHG